MSPAEISYAMQQAEQCEQPDTSDRALLALRDLLCLFIDAGGYRDFMMKSMSSDQLRFLNQLYMAVGL